MFSRYSCTYCGDSAEDLDHVIPHSYASSTGKRSYKKTKVVPCCRRCNSLLGNKHYFVIWERAAYLFNTYKRKGNKLLSLPEWTEEELEDMGDNFKKDIKKDRHLKEKLIEKLNVLELVHLMEPTIEDVWEEILLKEMKQNG
tara:strand:- start:22 stop:447 length:426 start_codon:yes stop_codon:yes gene_type:complete